jgi:hypothetical protein
MSSSDETTISMAASALLRAIQRAKPDPVLGRHHLRASEVCAAAELIKAGLIKATEGHEWIDLNPVEAVSGKRPTPLEIRDAPGSRIMARKKRTLEQRQARVREAWDRIEDAEPDISTERLLMMVADDTEEDYGDVASLYHGENPADL